MGKKSTVCRVCSRKFENGIGLEAVLVKRSKFTYLDAFNKCTHLNGKIGDGLPESLCIHCCEELKIVYEFIEKAEDTDTKLRKTLQTVRTTRSSGNIIKKEKFKVRNFIIEHCGGTEAVYNDIKHEFINCSKDPLEESDADIRKDGEKSEDEIEMNLLTTEKNLFKSCSESNKSEDYQTDDEDDTPLYELIRKKKLEMNKLAADSMCDTSPQIDDNSSEHENSFSGKNIKNPPDPTANAEAQIFPQGRYACKICLKTYFTASGLKSHILIHIPKQTKQKRKRGPNKNKKSKLKKVEKEEVENVMGEGEGENEFCSKGNEYLGLSGFNDSQVNTNVEKTFTKIAADSKRKRKQKTPKPKKMFPCHVCGKHMISASKLRYHMVMHTGEKDYLCTMCPKAYSTIYALQHHMRTHTGERPYECKFCGDKFTRPTTLKSHMRRHTGERPYGCDICGKRFIQHSSMTTHMKLNHMAKTIPCPHCDKKYARPTDLNTHLLSHTGDKPFSCQLCPSRFIRQANLNKHMNQHHPKKSLNEKIEMAVVSASPGVEECGEDKVKQVADNGSIDGNILNRSGNQLQHQMPLNSARLFEESAKASCENLSDSNLLQSFFLKSKKTQSIETLKSPTSLFSENKNSNLTTNQNINIMDNTRLPPMSTETTAPTPTQRVFESTMEELKTGQNQNHMDNFTSIQSDAERIGRSVEDILRWGWPHHA